MRFKAFCYISSALTSHLIPYLTTKSDPFGLVSLLNNKDKKETENLCQVAVR